MMVEVSTDEAPFLLDLIEQRRAFGQSRWDEWRHGAYRIMPIPTPEHARVVMSIATFMQERLQSPDLTLAIGTNVGIDLVDACVPEVVIFRRDSERTSEAFLATAELVVEVLVPGEPPGEKMRLYGSWNVTEYLEVDIDAVTAKLFSNHGRAWVPINHSGVIDFTVDEMLARLPD